MLNIAAFRQQMQMMGETVRWFKATPTSTSDPKTASFDRGAAGVEGGYVYREVTLPSAVRVLAHTLTEKWEQVQMGLFETGDMQITYMPDELNVGAMDKLLFPTRNDTARERVTRVATGDDTLDQPYAKQLLSVSDDTRVYVPSTDYVLAGNAVHWQSGAAHHPGAGAIYIAEYYYSPLFWYPLKGNTPARPVPLGNGIQTPQRAFLVKHKPGG